MSYPSGWVPVQIGQGGGGNDPDIPECPVCYARGGGGGHDGFCPNAGQPPDRWTSEPPPGYRKPLYPQ